jgi:dUTPase
MVYFNILNDENKNIYGFLPEKAENLSTGYDVRNAGPDIELYPFEKALIPLGFRSITPEGYYFELYPRSSTFHKKSIHSLYGVIDESYENYWYFSCQYIPESYFSEIFRKNKGEFACVGWEFKPIKIFHGDRIAQIILRKRHEMTPKEITNEEFEKVVKERGGKRGLGGFGSTGDR